jgi:tetratricopeptide (TPR) repeat protein
MELGVRQELLGAIDCCLQNSQQYLQNNDDRLLYAGLREGYQTSFATFYGQHDRFMEATKLFKEILDMPDHAQIPAMVKMRTMNNLGVVYLSTNQLEAAAELLNTTLVIKGFNLGQDHPTTMNTVVNVGNVYVRRGLLEEARKMYQVARDGYSKVHGKKHESNLQVMCNLGEISLKLGDLDEAQRQFDEALKDWDYSTSADTVLSLYIKSNLALVYKFQGRYLPSIALYEEVIRGREALLGCHNMAALLVKCELADVLLAAGRSHEANKFYEAGKADRSRRDRGVFEAAKLNARTSGLIKGSSDNIHHINTT